MSSSGELEAAKSVYYCEQTIQGGWHKHGQEYYTERRLDSISGPEGCLSVTQTEAVANQAATVVGVCDKVRKFHSGSKSSDAVSRVCDRHSEDDDWTSTLTGEGKTDSSGLRVGFATDELVCEGSIQVNRPHDGHHAGGFTCTTLLQELTEAQKQSIQSFAKLHDKCRFGPECKRRTALVEDTDAVV